MKSGEELVKLLQEKQIELRRFYFGLKQGKLTNVKAARNLRQEIARMMTRLRTLDDEIH
jgi:ribosomal protein L29